MKTIYKPIAVLIGLLFSNCLFAQQGPAFNNVKQQQRINGILNNVNTTAKIHANSNSVFGTNNSSANYKKAQPKKVEGKPGEEESKKSIKIKKQKQ